MDRFFTLASGSSGNCGIIVHKNTKLLIDCGISARRISNSLIEAGIDPASLNGVLITHEHSDHISGLSVFDKKYHIPIYTSAGTAKAQKISNPHIICADSPFAIGDIFITPFDTHHDSSESLAFIFDTGNIKYGYLTDCGNICNRIENALSMVQHLILESNYDLDMLMQGAYPYFLKKRICGPKGHLSNSDSGDFIAKLVNKSLKSVMLSHLSKENNTPNKALSSVTAILDGYKMTEHILLNVANRNDITYFID